MQRRTESPDEPRHIAVVGAGISGLRCADLLEQYGFRVTVVEGRSRLGGRLCQERLPNGHLVDMGPNWIHGTDDNPMLDLARQTGTSCGGWDTRTYVFDHDGQLLPIEDSERHSTMMWDIVKEAFDCSNKWGTEMHPDVSFWDFFRDKVEEKIPSNIEHHDRKRRTVLQMADLWGAFIGSPIHRQSLKFMWLEECIDGGEYAVAPRPVGR